VRVLGEMEAEEGRSGGGGGRKEPKREEGRRDRVVVAEPRGRARRMRPSDLGSSDWAEVRRWAPRGWEGVRGKL